MREKREQSDKADAVRVDSNSRKECPARKGLVLLVDDEESVTGICSRMLRLAGYQVATARDGRAALEAFSQRPHDFLVVLLDRTMPRLDGDATFPELRRIRPDIPVIFCSGYTEQEGVSLFPGDAHTGYLQKPYGLPDLVQRMSDVLKDGE
jgi:CheY-like chemotaxis protein